MIFGSGKLKCIFTYHSYSSKFSDEMILAMHGGHSLLVIIKLILDYAYYFFMEKLDSNTAV